MSKAAMDRNNRIDGRGYKTQNRNGDESNQQYHRNSDCDRRPSEWNGKPKKRESLDEYRNYGSEEKRYRREDENYYRRREERSASFGGNDSYRGNSSSYYQQQSSSLSRTGGCVERTSWSQQNEDNGVNRSSWNEEATSEDPKREAGSVNKSVISDRNNEGTPDVDEFGRKRISNGDAKTPKVKKPREWPPHFETHGSKYVLDSRSGMFYEAESDFFYDPKSKLYYGNKKRVYYRYNPENKKHFEQISSTDPATNQAAPVPTSADLAPDAILENLKPRSNSLVCETKNKAIAISITLKTKVLKSSAPSSQPAIKLPGDNSSNKVAVVPDVGRPKKEHQAYIEKWAERQVEKRNEIQADSSAKAITTQPPAPNVIGTTPKGEPMCTLCRRKFPTMEKLDYHIKISTLHKENLAKQATETPGTDGSKVDAIATAQPDVIQKSPPQPTYIDRAKQRRLLHGQEVANAFLLDQDSVLDAQTVATTELGTTQTSFRPGHDFGESNIGNQMLQKLGWKGGASLGRESTDETDSQRKHNSGSSASALISEWNRIESIAASNSSVANRTGNSQKQSGIGA